MPLTPRIIALALLAACALVWPAASAATTPVASAPACATTTYPGTPSAPSPGNPCWTDVPYPFGVNGTAGAPNSSCNGTPCDLQVTSMAFRSWNRGLASAELWSDGTISPATYAVWEYNGTRWFPNPTFPGGSVCKGDVILWAGKLDYWLVGDATGTSSWPALCRFDGVNDEWEALPVPAATRAEVPVVPGSIMDDHITTGACLAWNDCWFFGTGGVVVHWDGQSLSNASIGLGPSPWLQGSYTAAVVRTDAAGDPFGFAVADPPAATPADPAGARQPDGSPAPQLFASTGRLFSPLDFSSGASAEAGDDLAAVDFNSAGDGWLAANPLDASGTAASPLVRISTGGVALPCPGTPPNTFGSQSYTWTSVGVFPAGDVLAGGQSPVPGAPGFNEPVLVHASCDGAPTVTRFRVPETDAPPDEALQSSITVHVAVNAVNDAWAATGFGQIDVPGSDSYTPPQLYHLTDTRPPLAAAGNDREPRPVTETTSGAIKYIVSPTVVVPPPPPPVHKTKVGKGHTTTKREPSPIYGVTTSVNRTSNGLVTLTIRFKVRAPITLGVDAYHGQTLVGTSGLHSFRARTTGELDLTLNPAPANWPNRFAFVFPKTGRS